MSESYEGEIADLRAEASEARAHRLPATADRYDAWADAITTLVADRDAQIAERQIWFKRCKEAKAERDAAQAEVARLREALDAAWKLAKTMLKSARLQGPGEYQNRPDLMRAWVRTRYHDGKDLSAILKPVRAALQETATEQSDG